jgi:general stress protein YciG
VPKSKATTGMANKSQTQGGGMTVREAGRKGGEVTARRHGPAFYEEIGRKGGQKVKELIEQGKRAQQGS